MLRYGRTIRRGSAQALIGAAALCAFMTAASAQESKPAAPGVPPPTAGEEGKPGFIDAFGRFIGDQLKSANDTLSSGLKSASDSLGSGLKSANEAIGDVGNQTSEAAKGAVGTARDAAGTLMGAPNARIVTGHERCAAAANGAPDCRAAADAACRGKGFASGRMLDTESARTCSTRALLSGLSDRRVPSADDVCAQETFVTRAVCQ